MSGNPGLTAGQFLRDDPEPYDAAFASFTVALSQRMRVSDKQLTVQTLVFGQVVKSETGGPVQFVETPDRNGGDSVTVSSNDGYYELGFDLARPDRVWLVDLLQDAAAKS